MSKRLLIKLYLIIEQEAKKDYITSKDVLYAIAGIYSLEIDRLARNCQSKEDIDQQEKWIRDMLVNSFRPFFDERRKELLKQGSLYPSSTVQDSSNAISPYSKMDVFYQIADILTKNNVLPEDVLDIIGQLASTIAMIEGKSLDPVSEEKLKEIEEKLSNHIYEQILNGLDTVRLKQGMIKTN